MTRYRTRVLFFLFCYMTVVFMSLMWIYSPDNEGSQTVGEHPRVQHGQHQPLVVASTPIRAPGDTVVGHTREIDPECPGNGNKTQSTAYQELDNQHFFLTAYFDERKHPDVYIRILSVQPRGSAETLYCILGGDDGTPVHAVKVQKYPFNENHGKHFGGLILSCPVKGIVNRNPCTVRMSKEPRAASNTLTLPLLHIPKHKAQYGSEFGVCIPPLYGDVSLETLVDFVEATRQLGANHFYFYLLESNSQAGSVSSAAQTALQYYVDKGVATVYPWHLPVRDARTIWYNGQVLAIHHCLYQNMWRHRYLLFNDIDEILVPHRHETWNSLLSELDTDEYSGFQFSSAFFPPDNAKRPTVLHNVERSDINTIRTKCAVKPERIFEMGIHHISKWNEEEWPPMRIQATVALLHHYRRCDPFFGQRGFRCTARTSDRSILRHKDEIEKRFSSAMLEIQDWLTRKRS